MIYRFKQNQKEARVHFIPDLKDRVFVTLRTPEVIKEVGGKNLVHVRPSKTCRLTFYSSSIYSFPDNKLKQIRNKFETKIRTKPDKLRQNQDVLQCLINT